MDPPAHSSYGADGTQEPVRDPENTGWRVWWEAVQRARPRMKILNLGLLAAGCAYWAMLSIFPALIAVVTVYGLVANPQDVADQVNSLAGTLSPQAQQVLTDRLTEITSASGALSFGLVISLLVTLWTVSSGVQNLMAAVTTAYEQVETRSFVAQKVRALLLTVGAVILSVVVVFALTVLPALVTSRLDNLVWRIVIYAVGGLLFFAFIAAAIAVLYRFAPANQPVGWHWSSSGALIAAFAFVVVSIGFAFYVQNFAKYGNVYGALAGVIILLLWLRFTAQVILLGALVNAEAERGVRGTGEAWPEDVDRRILRTPQDDPV